jgi:hypothetical protein
MLVLTEEAYAQATDSSPNRNTDEGVISGAGVVELGGGGAAPGGRATEILSEEIHVGVWLRGVG